MSITSFIVNNKGDGERITNQFQDSLKELKPVLSNKELPSNKPVKSVAADLLKNY